MFLPGIYLTAQDLVVVPNPLYALDFTDIPPGEEGDEVSGEEDALGEEFYRRPVWKLVDEYTLRGAEGSLWFDGGIHGLVANWRVGFLGR